MIRDDWTKEQVDAYNAANKEYIDLGMVEAAQLSPKALAAENMRLAIEKGLAEVFAAIGVTKFRRPDNFTKRWLSDEPVNGVRFELELTSVGYSSSNRVWKLHVEADNARCWGRSDGKRYLRVGKGDALFFTPEQLEKAKTVIAEVAEFRRMKAENEDASRAMAERKKCLVSGRSEQAGPRSFQN